MGNCNTGQTGGSCSSNESAAYISISNKKIIAQLDDLEVVLDDMKAALAELCDEEGANLQLISGILSEIIEENEECCALLVGKLITLKTTIKNNVHICDEFTTTTTIANCGLDAVIVCDGTDITITITAGDDIGSQIALSYWDDLTSTYIFMGNISKANLELGYTIVNPPETTRFRLVDSACGTIEIVDFDSPCTTTSTPEPGTTTTSTTEEPGTTTTEEPATTKTTACADYTCGDGIINGVYYGDGYYTHPAVEICGNSDDCSNFIWETSNRPNRFSLYDDSGLIFTTGWKGQATYPGPWGLTLNTAILGTDAIAWVATTGRKVVVETGPADPVSPISDYFNWELQCTPCD